MASDIAALDDQLASAVDEMRRLITGLTEAEGTRRPADGRWSVAGCLDHVAKTNTAYLDAMRPAAQTARAKGRMRRGAAKPGLFGRLFVSLLEPPVKAGHKTKAPANLHPAVEVTLCDATATFLSSQDEIRSFLHANADLDLAGVTFPNPIVRGLRFSLATGLCNLLAHERRHLWQAQKVLQAEDLSRSS